ncbi:uncharacterized protein LOC113233995 [Hyposmocoma kahamanoa]|uniref:uncharacterized protein LOC113233995 n=1 Tax=Hyposmocoma kahamanoa TaxID=1477025 RepID=UPI000E6D620F|nr:uncharacterized protein LOC113233995 [Hyposmocoma kahamanoa]
MKWLSLMFLVGAVIAKHEEYHGYSLFEVQAKDTSQAKLLNQIENEAHGDIWSHALPGRPGYVLISKDEKHKFQDALEAAGLEYKIQTENIKE